MATTTAPVRGLPRVIDVAAPRWLQRVPDWAVIVVALIFMEWRSALLVALSIPLTIAMTLGICALIGIDLQQIAIYTGDNQRVPIDWTPGSEFSPGWVVWRTSPEWVGWAPMLPDQDVQKISAADFNNAGYWIFVETRKFTQGCTGAIAPAAQVPLLLKQTTYVTDIRSREAYGKCRSEELKDIPLPAHTFLNINQLAWPGMQIEIDVTAAVAP